MKQISVRQPGAAATLRAAIEAIWQGFRSPTGRRAAVMVVSGEESILKAKASFMMELLRRRMAKRGIAMLSPQSSAEGKAGAAAADETAILAEARALGADYGVVVSLDDLNCQVDESPMPDVEKLRVSTTLCVAYRIFGIGPDRLLAGQTLALCRRTSPIVRGTAVGSDVLNELLREIADRIDQQLESLQLPA